jgi:hypothetical protein
MQKWRNDHMGRKLLKFLPLEHVYLSSEKKKEYLKFEKMTNKILNKRSRKN